MMALMAMMRRVRCAAALLLMMLVLAGTAGASQPEPVAHRPGGEANLVLPDLGLTDVGGYSSRTLLLGGVVVSVFGVLFGLLALTQLRNLPVHRSMREISELIYETCKTYLITQGKFLALLEIFIAVIIVLYFGFLSGMDAGRVLIILLFSVVGILGSYGVAWFGIRVNTYANSRTAFASLEGRPYPVYATKRNVMAGRRSGRIDWPSIGAHVPVWVNPAMAKTTRAPTVTVTSTALTAMVRFRPARTKPVTTTTAAPAVKRGSQGKSSKAATPRAAAAADAVLARRNSQPALNPHEGPRVR